MVTPGRATPTFCRVEEIITVSVTGPDYAEAAESDRHPLECAITRLMGDGLENNTNVVVGEQVIRIGKVLMRAPDFIQGCTEKQLNYAVMFPYADFWEGRRPWKKKPTS